MPADRSCALVKPWYQGSVFLNSVFFSLLIALVSIPLILFRGSPTLVTSWFVPGVCITGVGLCAIWFRSCGADNGLAMPSYFLVWQDCLSLGVLATITIICFYFPQRLHFWGGYDDCQAYQEKVSCLWASGFDMLNGRPTLGWSYYLGWLLGGGTIEGVIWFAGVLCFANSALLWALIRLYMPQARSICLAAAVLLIINRSDPLKFYPLWAASPYALAVGFLLAAMLLFLTSWRRQNRMLLVVSCTLFAISLLMYEVGYLLAVLPLLLVWSERKQSSLWKFWTYSWGATCSLFAIRVAIFQLTSESSYQLSQASAAKASLHSMLSNFAVHIFSVGKFFSFSTILREDLVLSLVVFLIVFTAILIVGWNDCKISIRVWWGVLLFAALGIVLGVAPYSHLAGMERTQFFAAPYQSLFIAIVLAAIGFFLPRRLALVSLSGAVAVLSSNATVLSYVDQQKPHHITYEKIVHVCQQVRAIGSQLPPDVLIVLTHDGASPLGANYGAYAGSDSWLGAQMIQVGESPDPYLNCSFTPTNVQLTFHKDPTKEFEYDRLIIFRLDSDGTLYLELECPVDKLSTLSTAKYNPLNLLKAGKISNRRNFDFPTWSGPPADIVSFRDGIVLGQRWTSRGFDSGWFFRDAEQGAELIVNGQGQPTFELCLDVQLIHYKSATGTMEVTNAVGEVVGKVEVGDRKQVRMSLPSSKENLEVYRLKFQSDSPKKNLGNVCLRVFSPQGPLKNNTLTTVAQMTSGGLKLGSGWYSVEIHEGKCLRWLNTNGEIFSGNCDPDKSPALLLEASVGPGMDGKPCVLELRSSDGVLLSTATVSGHETVMFHLPKDFPARTRMLLNVNGGGHTIPTDVRILNLMVTKCAWQSSAVTIPDISDGAIRLRSGWYTRETMAEEPFRWINTEAEFQSGDSDQDHSPSVVLDLSPGPSLHSPIAMVDILDSSGNVLATHAFSKRERIAMPLNNFPGDNAVLRIQVRDGGKALPGETRILNAQIFRIEWQARGEEN